MLLQTLRFRMPLFRLLLVALLFSACAPDDAPDVEAAAPDKPTTSPDGPFDPLSPPAQAARPAGSAGTFVLRYIRGTGELADTTNISGFLPPPVPPDALGSVTLDAVPDYRVSVKPSSVPDAVTLRTAGGYVYATVNEVGELNASMRSATSAFPLRVDGLFRGEAYAFTFGPLWTGGNVEPQLWLRDHEKEDIVLGEMPLPIASAPVWAHPITLPAVPEDTKVTLGIDLEVTQTGLLPLLVFPSTLSTGWSARQLTLDGLTQGRRERAGDTSQGTPYRVYISRLDTSAPTAYLVLLRP